MRHAPIAIAMLLLATLTFASCGADPITSPPEPLGMFAASPFRFDGILMTVATGPRGAISGSGWVSNDTGDYATFTVGGQNPEVTFTVTTSNPAVSYYDGAQFRGRFRSGEEIVGTLTLRQRQLETIDLTFHRVILRDPARR
jgi:hypothetical protein